jgi:hypothetical protein
MFTRRELRHLVLDVEFVLISVVQGVALSTLAIEAAPMLRSHDVLAYVFVATGLLFVLSFWSVALIHAISFVTWPMDLVHYFFYFALALLECLTFTHMEHPRDWFGYSVAFFVVSWGLYVYDFGLIVRRRAMFADSQARRALYEHIFNRQRVEMLVLMPAGLVFNLVAYVLVSRRLAPPLPIALLQLLLTLLFMGSFLSSFSRRQLLITACAED